MTKDEALKLALEAMTYADACLKKQLTMKYKHEYAQDLLLEAGTAIKEALAQPEQEPVAWMTEDECEVYTSKQVDGCFQHDHIPLYITPPQRTWVGLTDEDFLEACQIAERGHYLVAFQRIQAKLRSKNESKN